MVPAELGHAEKILEKLGAKAEYLLVKESYGYGPIAVGRTAAVYRSKTGKQPKAMKN